MNDLQAAGGTFQGPSAAFACSLARHHPSSYEPPYNLPRGYEETSNGYTIATSHPDNGSRDPRSPSGPFAVQSLSFPLPYRHAQVLQNGFSNGAAQDHGAHVNGHAPPPMVWYNNGYDTMASSMEINPSIITDFADPRYSRYPSSSTAPSPGSDEKSQDISPRTPSHSAMAIPGAGAMDMDPAVVADPRQDDYPHASPTANLSIEAIINRDGREAGVATVSDARYRKHIDRADSKSPGISGRVPLSAQEIFKDRLGFAEDKRVLSQLNTNAFSVK